MEAHFNLDLIGRREPLKQFFTIIAIIFVLIRCGVEEPQSSLNSGSLPNNFSEKKKKRIVKNILSRITGFRGKCWKHVNDAVTGPGGARMGMSAMMFFKNTSTETMKTQFGLCKLTDSTGRLLTRIGDAPIGSILGYRPGIHGFHSKYGHGEVKVSSSRYCSDGCANRNGDFRATYILYPCE